MAHSDLIDSLIATYRQLNLMIRPLPNDQLLQPKADGKSLRDHLAELRDHEVAVSQQLKAMTLPEIQTAAEVGEVLPQDPALQNNVNVILSEFGTAREAILALIREMPDEEWGAERMGPEGPTTIHAFIEQLAAHDREALSRIEPLVPARAS